MIRLNLENYGKYNGQKRVLHKKARIYWNTSFGRLKFQFLNMEGTGSLDIIIFSFILDRNIILVSSTPLPH
ncbi:hypothetical protein RIR_jg8079.t1 [Rhizophagus irregularis DAOM 181602=DAOM 197198]|nr:hypothetical protein RIR_jg8079.t1 [Rhizophagus irregularis DAOM 181602=DAOM 197198]